MVQDNREIILTLKGEVDPSVRGAYNTAQSAAEAETRARLAGLQERRAALVGELQTVSASTTRYGRLGNAIDGVDTQIERVTESLRRQGVQADSYTVSRLSGLRRRRSALSQELQSVERGSAAYIRLGRQIDSIDNKISRLTGETETFTQRMNRLDNALTSIKGSLEQQSAELTQNRDAMLAQLRTLDRGSREYDQLRRAIGRADRQLEELNQSIREQNSLTSTLVRNMRGAQGAAAAFAGALGVGAGVAALDRLGESATRTLAVVDSLGLPPEFVQQIERMAQFVGRDLDFGDFNEFSIRVGELQNQLSRGELDGGSLQRFQEALGPLGLDLRTLSTRDLPTLLEGIRTLPREVQAFALDEILGGQFAEVVRQIDTLPPEIRDRFQQSTVSTREQLEAARELRAEMSVLRGELGIAALTLGTELVPVLTSGLELTTALVVGVRDLAETSPHLVIAIGGLSAALAIFAARAKIAAVSQAALLALSGPAGLATLAAGAAVAVGAGIAINRGLSIQSQRAEEEAQAAIQADATAEAVRSSVAPLVDQFKANSENTLRNILPAAECAAREVVNSAVGEGPTAVNQELLRRATEAVTGGDQSVPLLSVDVPDRSVFASTPRSQASLDLQRRQLLRRQYALAGEPGDATTFSLSPIDVEAPSLSVDDQGFVSRTGPITIQQTNNFNGGTADPSDLTQTSRDVEDAMRRVMQGR